MGLVRSGADVLAVSRSQAGLDQTRALATGSGSLETRVGDVTDAVAMERLFAEFVGRGAVDLIVNNAAVYPKTLLGEFDPEIWRSGVATNVDGVAYCCRAAIRALPKDRPAVVLNVGTFAYLGPRPGDTLYCATKAAVNAFTRALAAELAASGSSLIVNEWVPGVYRTQMSGFTGEEPSVSFNRLLAVWKASLGRPGGRVFGGAEEVLPPRSLKSRLLSLLLLRW